MWFARASTAFLILSAHYAAPVAAEDRLARTGLDAGAYEVEVDLQLPNLDNAGAKKTKQVCVDGAEGTAHGLAVLSGNNPLAKCPVSEIRETGGRLTFEIVCPGPNAARAFAKYTLGGHRFRGSIAMNMGGKNMTMTEVQTGHRVGACDAAEQPRS